MEESMKSAYFKAGLIVLAMILMTSCSGGGKSGSATNVTLRIGTTDPAQKKSLFGLPLTAPIPSVVKNITITVTASDITTISQAIPISSSTQSLLTTFSVPNGTARVITVTGDDGRGNITFKGSSSPLDLNGTDTSVSIQMIEDIKAAITARLLIFFKDALEPKIQAGTLTATDIDPFYVSAAQYGINNGVPRDSVIAKDVKDFSTDFLRKTMSSIQINVPQPDPQNIKYTVAGKGTFSDGSFGFPDDGFIMMKENGEWKFAGNGFKSDVELRNASLQFLNPAGASQLTGLAVSISDPGNIGISSATITSPAVTIDLIKSAVPSGPNNLVFTTSPCGAAAAQGGPGGINLYCLSDAVINSIAANTTYTVSIKDVNGAVIETRTVTLPARPLSSTELTAGHFPTISIPAAYPATTDGHFLADARIGAATGLALTLGKPTAFTASWLEANFHHSTFPGIINELKSALLLSDTSATFPPTFLPSLAFGAFASVRAEDFDNRRAFMTFWQFNGPQGPSPISFFQTTNVNVANGVTAPVATTVWKFGDPVLPKVVWSGFPPITSSVDIYLLVDDPTKLLTPLTSGNPFPNVVWKKLNANPLGSLGSGSFTLAVQPELLGITGSACRVLVVEPSLSGSWALSPPFTIGP
jgi:hypothetical protein